jgi:uncharacterized protein YbcI
MQTSNTYISNIVIITLKNNICKYIIYYTRFKITIKQTRILLLKT